MATQRHLSKLQKFLARQINPEEVGAYIREHGLLMADLMGVQYESLAIVSFDNEAEFEHYVLRDRSWERTIQDYRNMGYPIGCARTDGEYGRSYVFIFSWQVSSYHVLNEVLMHELAHVATNETNLLTGPQHIRTFVNERIIIPMLEAMYYDPLLKLLQPRRVQASTPDDISVCFPGAPRRLR